MPNTSDGIMSDDNSPTPAAAAPGEENVRNTTTISGRWFFMV